MESIHDGYREMVLFYYSNVNALLWILRNGIGEPNERDDIRMYSNKFYSYAKDGTLKDLMDLSKLTGKCKVILDRYSVPSDV